MPLPTPLPDPVTMTTLPSTACIAAVRESITSPPSSALVAHGIAGYGRPPWNRTLDGRVVLVTGGGSGIGRATALRGRARGAARPRSSTATPTTPTRPPRMIAAAGGTAIELPCRRRRRRRGRGPRSPPPCDELGRTRRRGHRGRHLPRPRPPTARRGVGRRLHPRARASTSSARSGDQVRAPPSRRRRLARSSVVTIASTAAIRGHGYGAGYTASKGGVDALTRLLAVQYGPHGVRANCICPGGVDTPMTGGVCDTDDARAREARRAARRGRAARGHRVVAVFLLSATRATSPARPWRSTAAPPRREPARRDARRHDARTVVRIVPPAVADGLRHHPRTHPGGRGRRVSIRCG